ncbi:MAG: putative Nucleoside diphosphate kinase [Parcubacteria group bacterium]|nr:putative Nucleoside diphosphate kinase [Parcubacteria group bacterium]
MNHPKKERTFVVVKHDGVQRGLVGEIISRIERTGLKIVGLKMFVPAMDKTVEHYGKDDAWCEKAGQRTIDALIKNGGTAEKTALEYGRGILDALYRYFTLGPIVGFVVEGNKAVDIVKKLVGGTEPTTSDVGTIRGDLTLDSYEIANVDGRAVRNLMHCSDKIEEAEREIQIWWRPEELIGYTSIQEKILYDANIDGILE